MSNIPVNKIPSQLPVPNRLSNNTAAKSAAAVPFHEILKSKQVSMTSELKFSKHANERLASRNIDLSEDQYRRLEMGARMAYEKGIRESLVMVDDLAFIVNIKNNTVITAVNEGEEKVFTNIDGAVII
ncbi:MAG: flagellar protein [Clostridiales bacterium]|jgi:flagellar operon protein|nr:flagellar protein [Clostridiales bacterium]